jgi:hypothetical protein
VVLAAPSAPPAEVPHPVVQALHLAQAALAETLTETLTEPALMEAALTEAVRWAAGRLAVPAREAAAARRLRAGWPMPEEPRLVAAMLSVPFAPEYAAQARRRTEPAASVEQPEVTAAAAAAEPVGSDAPARHWATAEPAVSAQQEEAAEEEVVVVVVAAPHAEGGRPEAVVPLEQQQVAAVAAAAEPDVAVGPQQAAVLDAAVGQPPVGAAARDAEVPRPAEVVELPSAAAWVFRPGQRRGPPAPTPKVRSVRAMPSLRTASP